MTEAELAQKYVEQTSGKIYSSEDALRFQAYYDGRKDGRKEVEKHLTNGTLNIALSAAYSDLQIDYSALQRETENSRGVIAELIRQNAAMKIKIQKLQKWIDENLYEDGCIDCSPTETDELLEILKNG